jgi:hypothetical protein
MMPVLPYAKIAIALAILGFVGWAFRVDHLRAYWRETHFTFKEQVVEERAVVTARIGRAVGNPKLKWKDVPKQVEDFASGFDQLVAETGIANARIDALGAESERLKALNADLRVRAEKIIRERAKLIDRLAASANDPGERENCQAQIAAAEAALDAVFEEGL